MSDKKTAYYLLYRAQKEDTEPAPITFWFSGGPGGSGLGGLFFEIGSFKAYKDGQETKIVNTNLGWDQLTNIVYVDNPIGVGYSYSTEDVKT